MAPRSDFRICELEQLSDPGSAVFDCPAHRGGGEFMLIRYHGRVYAYLNNCPHTGGPLDWVPGIFLDAEQRYIQCATHDALFRIDDGECVFGPCAGQCLQGLAVHCRDGAVWLSE